MPGGRFTNAELAEIRSLSSRKAASKFSISFATWTKIKRDPNWIPTAYVRDDRANLELGRRVLENVKATPHINTSVRSKLLKIRTETIQKILAEHGLTKLNARLQFAGYKVDVLRPLQVARQRRVVATRPGSLTHIDYKAFGFLRGLGKQKGIRVGGYCCIDSLTGFATVLLTDHPNGSDACAALEKYRSASPFGVEGIVFSDNSPTDFLSDLFIDFVAKNGLFQRTTRYNSPWSNGKVEALNKTLKYQCFPAIAAANCTQWAEVEQLVDTWMEFYNKTRAHTGHVNKGLPPLIWYELWENTPGNHLEKLTQLGVLPVDKGWALSMMGNGQGSAEEQPWGPGEGNGRRGRKDRRLPYAFILTRDRKVEYTPGWEQPKLANPKPSSGQKTSFILAK